MSGDLEYVRSRVANACNNCKARKVKCDGKLPCGYCIRRHRAGNCHFSPRTRRRTDGLETPSREHPVVQIPPVHHSTHSSPHPPSEQPETSRIPLLSPRISANIGYHHHGDASAADEEADVHREARLLCDAQGKLTFIGDCAPLSFFQTVRQIVISRVDPHAFAPQTSRFSMLENISSNSTEPSIAQEGPPKVDPEAVGQLLSTFASVTSGFVDFIDCHRFAEDLETWISRGQQPHDITSAVNYLVLAIGAQTDSQDLAARYFHYAKTLALASLDGNLGVATVQAFALIALYMLRACQINGAFLFFGIAARAAYSIGAHRAEVNSRFEVDLCTQRNRLWRSLRVLDLFLSASQGRPPAMSDVDCTVPYQTVDDEGREVFELLDASVQIFLITERVVLEVYSRRKITLQLTEGISRQLRDWSGRWLSPLKRIVSAASKPEDRPRVAGACQVLSSYYYCVMLVSRPFLVYELYRRVPEDIDKSGEDRTEKNTGRCKLANACIDAACLMSESVLDLVERGALDRRSPLLVSWLFASALVIGVGLLGGFGRVLDRYVCMAISGLEFFAKEDAHAMQYSFIAKSLLSSARQYLETKETQERLRISEGSSQLFGLIPKEGSVPKVCVSVDVLSHLSVTSLGLGEGAGSSLSSASYAVDSPFADIDSSIFPLDDPLAPPSEFPQLAGNPQDQINHVFGALNLFPLLDGNGHIDLAHYL